MKKASALILIFSLFFAGFCGCKRRERPDLPAIVSNIGSQNEGGARLAYSKSDPLDPFACSTRVNMQILGLVYDGLYKLDKSYAPIPVVAKNSIVDGACVNVALSDARFWDSSAITADDVVYSFDKAKFSPAYSSRLENFVSARVSSPDSLIFTLKTPDPYAAACLSFPIVKNGSTGEFPTGSGRYSPKKSGESIYLVVNPLKSGFNPAIKTVSLVPIKDFSTLESGLEIGNVGFYFNDLRDGVFKRINAKTVEMGINNFVYLAFNPASEKFADPAVRRAINLAIDREDVVVTAFQNRARAACSPFNPDWGPLASKDLTITSNPERARLLISESGVKTDGGEIILLVNKDNPFKVKTAEIIKNSLSSLGFKIAPRAFSSDDFAKAVELGAYDLYIGEIKLSPNMNLSPLFGKDAGRGAGLYRAAGARYSQFLSGGCELMDFINAFNDDPPFIPLCYRNAVAFYANFLKGDFACCDADVFYDVETWSFK